MGKVLAIFRVLAVLVLVFIFVKNMQQVTLTLYLGYSLALPFFLWILLALLLGVALGYSAAWCKLHRQRALLAKYVAIEEKARAKSEASQYEDQPRIASVAEAFKSVRSAPKGDDEHHHYGI
jgi:uncharacterized integral membrane protein